MNSTLQAPALPAAAQAPKPSAFARLAGRASGTVVSLILHGGLVFLAFLTLAQPRMGRGGGTAGSPDGGAGPREYSAELRPEAGVDTPRTPDARLFSPPEPDPEELPEAVPPPPEDFLKDPSETGVPAAKAPPQTEPSTPLRHRQAYAKLPPSSGSETGEAPSTSTQKGNSTVNGTGGDTGGAGDGTVGALYMPAPDYPASARRKNIEGVVGVAIDVHPDGRIDNVRLEESSGCDALDDSALSAIRKWKYEARPKEETVVRHVRFVFKLQR